MKGVRWKIFYREEKLGGFKSLNSDTPLQNLLFRQRLHIGDNVSQLGITKPFGKLDHLGFMLILRHKTSLVGGKEFQLRQQVGAIKMGDLRAIGKKPAYAT